MYTIDRFYCVWHFMYYLNCFYRPVCLILERGIPLTRHHLLLGGPPWYRPNATEGVPPCDRPNTGGGRVPLGQIRAGGVPLGIGQMPCDKPNMSNRQILAYMPPLQGG